MHVMNMAKGSHTCILFLFHSHDWHALQAWQLPSQDRQWHCTFQQGLTRPGVFYHDPILGLICPTLIPVQQPLKPSSPCNPFQTLLSPEPGLKPSYTSGGAASVQQVLQAKCLKQQTKQKHFGIFIYGSDHYYLIILALPS